MSDMQPSNQLVTGMMQHFDSKYKGDGLGYQVEVIDAPLTIVERDQLQGLESTIERGLSTFSDVGAALVVIRDNRLYREAYGRFEDYCKERWGFSNEYARLHMRAAEVIGNLSQTPTIVGVLPITESQARPLTKLEPAQQREAWAKAVETAPNGKVTAAHVEKTVTEWRYDQGIQYGAVASSCPEPEPEDDILTVTIRAFELGFFMGRFDKRYTAAEAKEEFGLSPSGAHRLLSRVCGSHRVPVTRKEGEYLVLAEMDAGDLPA